MWLYRSYRNAPSVTSVLYISAGTPYWFCLLPDSVDIHTVTQVLICDCQYRLDLSKGHTLSHGIDFIFLLIGYFQLVCVYVTLCVSVCVHACVKIGIQCASPLACVIEL